MGRTKQTKRTRSRKGGRRDNRPWQEIIQENAMFEKYYKAQNIIPESEWEDFMTAYRRDLPSTFRITGTRSQSKRLLQFLKKNYLDDMSEIVIEDEKVEAPKPLLWYPEDLGWQVNLSRKFIRKSSALGKFHNFLVQETECGNISRQEAVSMIPPLLMDIKPGQKVLDTCAAPGSKTSQIIELLHADESNLLPDGLVIANELQNKRCYMLIHQSKRLRSPSCLITNHDAAFYPTLFVKNTDGEKVQLKFDRILCDVPCSGDGTMRKNQLIWNKWTPQLGLSLHRVQLRILARAIEMLEIGGRLVYSTCSLNPAENEAVVSQLLKHSGDAVELLDVSGELPNLKRSPGLLTWKLMMKDGEEVTSCDPGTPAYKGCFRPSHFPPSEEEAKNMNLERCVRIYPHQQDTGGFFIAVLHKHKCAPWENENRCNNNPRWLPWQSEADGQLPKSEKGDTESAEIEESVDSEDVVPALQDDQDDATETAAQAEVVEMAEEDVLPSVQDDQDDVTEAAAQNEVVEMAEVDVTESAVKPEPSNGDDGATADSAATNVVQGKRGLDDNDNKNADEKSSMVSATMKPPKKKPKMDLGFREDPFILLPSDDPVWVTIKDFYGIDPSFPSDQLLVRTISGKKRSIYIVSKLVKQVLECVDDNVKIINCGVKTFCRCDADEQGCEFRIMQEGIESMYPFVTKRKIQITQADVFTFLEHDKPFTNKFSETTRDQLKHIAGIGCVLFVYDPNGPHSSPTDSINCEFHFCGWKAKTSLRVLASRMDKTHYMVLCGIPPGDKVKNPAKDEKSQENNEDEPKEMDSIKCLGNNDEPEITDVGFV